MRVEPQVINGGRNRKHPTSLNKEYEGEDMISTLEKSKEFV